jgi:hypothetical protein
MMPKIHLDQQNLANIVNNWQPKHKRLEKTQNHFPAIFSQKISRRFPGQSTPNA